MEFHIHDDGEECSFAYSFRAKAGVVLESLYVRPHDKIEANDEYPEYHVEQVDLRCELTCALRPKLSNRDVVRRHATHGEHDRVKTGDNSVRNVDDGIQDSISNDRSP